MNKYLRWSLTAVGVFVLFIAFSWVYTTLQLAHARSDGVYPTAEQGMTALVDKAYPPDRQIKILYAGTNSFDGSAPHVWYVIAEVRASARADGSEMGHNGCDAPGSFFLQTREGWVHVSEGAFPGFMGFWMKVFGWAGEGQSTPSTDLLSGPTKFCQ